MATGGFWNISELLAENPLPADEPIKWNYLAQGEHSTVNVVQSRGGRRLHIHKDHDEIVYILSGERDFRVGEVTRRVRPGDLVFIPAGTVHGPVAAPGVVGASLSVYAPAFDPQNPDRVWVEEQK